MNTKRNRRIAGFAFALLFVAGTATLTTHARTTAAPTAPPPPDVEVATVQQMDLPIQREWVGTLDGLVNAAIKAQVSGYLLSQNYSEGSFVRKGQLLFEIDPRPFQAVVDQAAGQLAQARAQLTQAQAGLIQSQSQLTTAEANQHRAQLDEDRYTPLAAQHAVPQRAVIDTQGTYMVAVVDPNNTVRFAPVKAGDRVGSNWAIEEGLKPGERVVTDGLFHIRPGAVVNPKGGN